MQIACYQQRNLSKSQMPYRIHEVNGVTFAETINAFHKLLPEGPEVQPRHFTNGYWWFAYLDDKPIAFAGLVPFVPFPDIGYLKRCNVMRDHHGLGFQVRLCPRQERKARG